MAQLRVGLVMWLGLAATGAALAASFVQAGSGGAVLVVTGETARLELEDGRLVQVKLPRRAQVSALERLADGWVIAGSFRTGEDEPRLFLLAEGAAGVRGLAAPGPARPGSLQRGPVLLVEEGRLAGIAWLEGDREDSLGVRAATWNGRRFSPAVWASGPGRRSQLALAGAVLADGSWLLAWSAFDGEDDEIVWTRRVGGVWQPPARVEQDDLWPDITPALWATEGGALLAWSGYDGATYRTVLASFTGEGWDAPRAVGDRGTLYPVFRGGPEAPRLLFFDARRSSWELVEFDGGGGVWRRASAPALFGDETPVVAAPERGGGVVLRWPGRAREARAEWREAK